MYYGDSLSSNSNFIVNLENYMDFEIDSNYLVESLEDFLNIKYYKTRSGLHPIYVVLTYCDTTFDKIAEKFVKGQSFWHASISLTPDLSTLYSFNFGRSYANKFKGGLAFETLDDYKKKFGNGNIEVSCFLIGSEKFEALKSNLNNYIKNKAKTSYSFINLFWNIIGKKLQDGMRFSQVCSSFVDSLLKSIGIDINGKPINLVKPDDLKRKDVVKKQFVIFDGKISKYNEKSAKRVTNKLLKNQDNDYFYNTDSSTI